MELAAGMQLMARTLRLAKSVVRNSLLCHGAANT
jgi:hypothetical protein